MTSHRMRVLALVALLPIPLLGQAARTGAAAAAPQLAAAPRAPQAPVVTSPQTGVVPGTTDNANRDVLLSPSESVQQFRAQRAAEINTAGTSAAALPGASVPVSGAGLPAGAVVGGQVVSITPGTSITVLDLSGLTRTFPLPANYTIPADVTAGTFVALTTLNGGFVTVANANGVLPSSTVTGGIGEGAPNLTQVAAANGSLVNPNLTTRQIPPQNPIAGIGGFYAPGAAAPGYVVTPPEGATLAGAGYVSPTAPSGIPATAPFTSISWTGSSLASAVAREQGTRRLPAAATFRGALATIEGAGRDVVTKTALASWRVVFWDGDALVVKDDRGHRRRFAVAAGTAVPRDMKPGQLVVLDLRDDTLRAVRYVL